MAAKVLTGDSSVIQSGLWFCVFLHSHPFAQMLSGLPGHPLSSLVSSSIATQSSAHPWVRIVGKIEGKRGACDQAHTGMKGSLGSGSYGSLVLLEMVVGKSWRGPGDRLGGDGLRCFSHSALRCNPGGDMGLQSSVT